MEARIVILRLLSIKNLLNDVAVTGKDNCGRMHTAIEEIEKLVMDISSPSDPEKKDKKADK